MQSVYSSFKVYFRFVILAILPLVVSETKWQNRKCIIIGLYVIMYLHDLLSMQIYINDKLVKIFIPYMISRSFIDLYTSQCIGTSRLNQVLHCAQVQIRYEVVHTGGAEFEARKRRKVCLISFDMVIKIKVVNVPPLTKNTKVKYSLLQYYSFFHSTIVFPQ